MVGLGGSQNSIRNARKGLSSSFVGTVPVPVRQPSLSPSQLSPLSEPHQKTNQQQRNNSTQCTTKRVFSQVKRIIETDGVNTTLEEGLKLNVKYE